MKRKTCAFVVLSLCFALVGCGTEEEPTAAPGEVESAGIRIPQQVLGLTTQVEDVNDKLAGARRPYIDSIGLFSFREKELVRATFQVSRFNRLANPKSQSFRDSVISLLGTTQPQRVEVGDHTIYVTTGNEQNIFVWFEGRGFFVLTTHRDYEFPRTLLRRLLDLGQSL